MTDRSLAAQTFGAAGTLERAIEECATYSDNILAFRVGAVPMQLTGVGLDTTADAATPGFNIIFNDVTSDAAARYQLWYKAGVLSVWKDGTLVYSNVADASIEITTSRSPAATEIPRACGPGPDPPGRGWQPSMMSVSIPG